MSRQPIRVWKETTMPPHVWKGKQRLQGPCQLFSVCGKQLFIWNAMREAATL